MTEERGASPIELALGLMLLVVPMAIVVLSIAPVFEHRNFVRRAAAEAARTLVLAQEAPERRAREVVDELALGMAIDPADVEVSFCGGLGCVVERGAQVTVEVTVRVRQVSAFLPIGELTVSGTHSEQVDPFRSRS
jgi:Flp pilus assembly protein TadG